VICRHEISTHTDDTTADAKKANVTTVLPGVANKSERKWKLC